MSLDDHEYYGGSSLEDDPHVYPNGVLVNLPGFQSTAELGKYEEQVSALRGFELHDAPILGNLDLEHAQKIHHHLFQDVYPWAGSLREVDISKGDTMFLSVEKIREEFGLVSEHLVKSGLALHRIDNEKEFSSAAGIFLGKVNQIHPFREGNGRTQRQLLRILAEEHGFDVNWSGTSPESMKRACIDSQNDPDCKAIGKLIFLAQTKITNDLSVDNGILSNRFFKMIESEGLSMSNESITDVLSVTSDRADFDLSPKR